MNEDNVDLKKEAIALYYDGKTAPKVMAKGKGYVANEILKIAEESNVPIREEANLVQFLTKVDLGDEIPEALYMAAAEVIAFAYKLKHKFPPSYDNS